MIVGLGKTGYSCAMYLTRKGIPFSIVDQAEHPYLLAKLKEELPEVHFSKMDLERLVKAEEIILSPGVPLQSEAIQTAAKNGARITGDIAIFADEVDKPFVAITGSNGKSTVTKLVAEMTSAAGVDAGVGGNIGTPCLDMLNEGHDLYILEVSSYQLEVVEQLNAGVAVILNLTPDHLDRYRDVTHYYETKARIYRGCKVAILNRDLDFDFNLSSEVQQLTFGLDEPSAEKEFGIRTVEGRTYLSHGHKLLLDTQSLRLRGRHNWLNALAALAIGHAVGLTTHDMICALEKYPGLPHRCEWLGAFSGADFYNDSKSTNPGSTRAAIEGLSEAGRQIVLILGGDCKGADLSDLAPLMSQVRRCFVFGKDRQVIASMLHVDAVVCETLEQVIAHLIDEVRDQDQVLLSPACASLDQFDNYEHRGDEFGRLVMENFA